VGVELAGPQKLRHRYQRPLGNCMETKLMHECGSDSPGFGRITAGSLGLLANDADPRLVCDCMVALRWSDWMTARDRMCATVGIASDSYARE
jgi:hypothetical protein